MSDKIRKEFEKWVKTLNPTYSIAGSISSYGNFGYDDGFVGWMFKGWQAAYKASRHDELVELARVGYFALCDAVANSTGVPLDLIKKRDKAQELLKSMEK